MMKRRFSRGMQSAVGFSALFLLCAVPLSAAPSDRAFVPDAASIERQSKAALLIVKPVAMQEDTLHPWDQLHLDIHLRITSIPADSADMVVTQTVIPLSDGQQAYVFNLGPASVISLTVDGIASAWNRADDEITVQLPSTANVGDTISIRTGYRIPIRSNNYAGGLVYGSGADVLYSHGEPYTTRWWVACYDYPGDKVTSTVTAMLPEAYRVLSNGFLVTDSVRIGGLRTVVWNNPDPISTYLISVAAHPYTIVDAGVAGVNDAEVHYWVYPGQANAQAFDFGRTPQMIEQFESKFGPYPFNKYDQAVAPIFDGNGAMENQTATTFGFHLVGNGARLYEGVVAHELAHQWWGDMLSPKTFASVWLNEGFASYGEVVWAESLGGDTMASVLQGQLASFLHAEGQGENIALHDPPDKYLFSATVYDKGSRVLHMLRYLVGDSLFFEGLRQYGVAFAYGNVETSDFQTIMETVSGVDLADFFNQWVYQPGYPIYAFSRFTVEEVGGGWTASVQLNQTQNKAPYYSLPLPLKFEDAFQDTVVRVPVQALAEQELNVENLSFKPDRIVFDPDGWILSRYNLSSIGGQATVNSYSLGNAWPNPFNGETHINLVLNRPVVLKVEVFNLLGRRVLTLADGYYQPGLHKLVWQAPEHLSSGVYFIRANADNEQTSRKIVLLK